jgi:Tfp pilus assembly protein PilF
MIKEYPDVIYGYANLGVLYLANNKFDLAEKYLNQALTIDPNDEIVLGTLSILKERRK